MVSFFSQYIYVSCWNISNFFYQTKSKQYLKLVSLFPITKSSYANEMGGAYLNLWIHEWSRRRCANKKMFMDRLMAGQSPSGNLCGFMNDLGGDALTRKCHRETDGQTDAGATPIWTPLWIPEWAQSRCANKKMFIERLMDRRSNPHLKTSVDSWMIWVEMR